MGKKKCRESNFAASRPKNLPAIDQPTGSSCKAAWYLNNSGLSSGLVNSYKSVEERVTAARILGESGTRIRGSHSRVKDCSMSASRRKIAPPFDGIGWLVQPGHR
jgi:hypothetical protein